MTTVTITGTNQVTGEASAPAAATFTVTRPAPGGTLYGATAGQGAGNTHATPDLAGWKSYQAKTGTYAAVTKLFAPASGYPDLWPTWKGSLGEQLAANNGGRPLLVLIAFNNIPTVAAFTAFLGSLPAGQRAGFIYQSEPENSGSGISGAAFTTAEHTISGNLNTALAAMALHPVTGNTAGFYTRANFPNVTSAYMAYYQANPGSTAYIPALGDADIYGADLYHKGPATDNVASADPRYQGYVKAVKAKLGAAAAGAVYGFPEYGIDVANITDAQRAQILAGDIAYMTGPNAPGAGFGLLNYWFEVGNSGQQYPFTAPSATASAWQKLCT